MQDSTGALLAPLGSPQRLPNVRLPHVEPGATLAEVEALTDADIRALAAYLDEAASTPEPVEATASPSVEIVAFGAEKKARGKKARKHTEKRRLQLVESARRHRDRKKVNAGTLF